MTLAVLLCLLCLLISFPYYIAKYSSQHLFIENPRNVSYKTEFSEKRNTLSKFRYHIAVQSISRLVELMAYKQLTFCSIMSVLCIVECCTPRDTLSYCWAGEDRQGMVDAQSTKEMFLKNDMFFLKRSNLCVEK